MSPSGRAVAVVYVQILLTFLTMVFGWLALALLVGASGAGSVRVLLLSVLVAALVLTLASLTVTGLFSHGLTTPLRRLGLEHVPTARTLAIAAWGTIGASLALDGLIQALGLAEVGKLAELEAQLVALPTGAKVVAALALGFFPGIGEELFFRGYVFTRLTQLRGLSHGMWASALTFGLFHLDVVQSPAAALLGVYLALSFHFTRSLWVPICAHALNNAVATLFTMIELAEWAHGVLAVTGLVAAVSALLVLWPRPVGLPADGQDDTLRFDD